MSARVLAASVARWLAHLGVAFIASCHGSPLSGSDDTSSDAPTGDGGEDPLDGGQDGGPEGPLPRTLYPEGARHSPITLDVVARMQMIAATQVRDGQVFAKVGDSLTVAPEFLNCFGGGAVALGSHATLAPTLMHFRAGNAAGTSPFARASVAARGGTTAVDAMTGTPCPLQREIDTIDPRIAVTMFGTNEVRFGWTVHEYGVGLWSLVDETIANGTVPILSTIPPMNGDPGADARIPTFNRVVRAIAQGRGVPLVDLHRGLVPLANRGLAQDGIHLTASAQGGCDLTDAGLAAGYNVRNLFTLEALARTTAALDGVAADSSAPQRSGAGTVADPVLGELPLMDLGDTRTGSSEVATYACSGRQLFGHEIVYRLDLAAQTTLAAHVITRTGVDVDVHVLTGSAAGACVASGDQLAVATVSAGPVFIVVDGPDVGSEGEFVLVVERR